MSPIPGNLKLHFIGLETVEIPVCFWDSLFFETIHSSLLQGTGMLFNYFGLIPPEVREPLVALLERYEGSVNYTILYAHQPVAFQLPSTRQVDL